jgi:hypothetical protein
LQTPLPSHREHDDAMMPLMRTTLTLPDDVYKVARSLAADRRISLGDAIALLVRRGLQPIAPADTSKAFPCFRLPQGAEPITLERTLSAEDDL